VESTSTILTELENQIAHQPDEIAVTWLHNGETPAGSLTYRQLAQQARTIASYLLQSGVTPGERVLLVYAEGLEFLPALLGCLVAGVVAVPTPAPDALRGKRTLPHMQAVSADAQACLILTTERLKPLLSLTPALPTLTTDDLPAYDAHGEAFSTLSFPFIQSHQLAYLQYTSGSTGTPKGVMISHANVLANVDALNQAWGYAANAVALTWMPHTHDFGLVEGLLHPLLAGAPNYIMAPGAFLRKPLRWLKAISRLRVTNSAAATFAYQHCLQQFAPDQCADLDLSCWRVAPLGAEPIRPAMLEDFAAAFAPYGFAWNALCPGYGLAEGTLIATARGPESDLVTCCRILEGHTTVLTGCGHARADTSIKIVDPVTHCPLPEGEIGEIWVSGTTVALGYWNRPDETRETFGTTLDGTPYLRTGDLGLLEQETLFISGRLKDLLIIHGQNYHPQDIEWSVEAAHPLLKNGSKAAFAIEIEDPLAAQNAERLVIVCEIDSHAAKTTDLAAVIQGVRERVATDFALPVHAVTLIRRGLLTKTPSGKVQRRACRTAWLNGELDSLFAWQLDSNDPLASEDLSHVGSIAGFAAPKTPTEDLLAQIWSEVLRVPAIGMHQDFFALGGHSVLAVQVVSQVQSVLGVELSLREFFETPTVAQLAAYIDLRRGEPSDALTAPIPPATTLMVSPMQRWLGYACAKDPDSPVYNMPILLRLRGNLNPAVLQQALQAIVMRHETLRSAFTTVLTNEGETLTLTIRERVSLDLPLHDLSELARAERESRARAEIATEARQSFDLEQDLLVRAHLWRLGANEHWLLLNLHHLVFDGWSQDVLLSELATLYNALLAGQAAALPTLPIRYRDYAEWRQQGLESANYRRQLDYWNRKLENTPTLLELPTDRSRPDVKGNFGARIDISLSPELIAGLRRVSQAAGATLFMTLLGAWQALLGRYSGQEDFVVYTPMAGRTRPETEGLIGYLVNLVPVHADLTGDPSVPTLLKRVRETLLDAFANQDVAMEQVNSLPRLQTLFFLISKPHKSLLTGLDTMVDYVPTDTAKFELSLELEEHRTGVRGWLEYDTNLFAADTIARMAGHLQTLLTGIVDNPNQTVAALPLLTQTERQQLLVDWNPPAADQRPVDHCLHELFAAQVQHNPEAVALVYEQEHLTYRQLDARANQLAHHLVQRGVGPEILVGLFLERSLELIVGMLAILKAGGAYLPLDVACPPDRLQFMVEDAGVRLVLTQRHLVEQLPLDAAQAFCLDTGWQTAVSLPDTPLPHRATPDNRAYVIYTSGSTGTPKGVQITHANVVRLMQQTQPWFQFDSRDVWTLFHSPAFDFSVWEIWGALLYGGKLVIVPYLISRSPEDFHALLLQQRVTVLNQTPSAFQQLIRADEQAGDQSEGLALRLVIFGGEALDFQSLRPWFARHGETMPQLVNMYGITETTVHVTYYPIRASDAVSGKPGLIGVPIPDLRLYVLDAHQQPVPLGVRGELYVGGAGLARGYLDRPELTAERFVADPFSEGVGTCLYRTGDLARWWPDGNLEYLGRIDHQVKLRGFRVELGEIEAVLGAHVEVAAAVVLAREDVPGDQRLVAYVVAQKPAAGLVEELKALAREKLPEYMVPAHIVLLEQWPLTSNGKVDRKALPAPDFSRADTDASFAAPGTPTEELLAQIWSRVLRVPAVGVTDSFFALGGHSLLAIRLLLEVEQECGVRLSLASMLKAPTVREMAQLLSRRHQGDSQWSSLVPLQPLGERPPLFCAPPGGGGVFYYRTLATHIGKDQPLYTLEPRGLGDDLTPHETFEEMATYFIEQIRTVQPTGPYYLGGFSAGGVIAYEMAQQLQRRGEEVALVLLLDTAPVRGELRKASKPRQQWWRLSYQLRKYLSELSACATPAAKWAYLRTNAREVAQRVKHRLTGRAWVRTVNPAQIALPEAYQALREAEEKAGRAYHPQSYSGTVRLLRAQVPWPGQPLEPGLGWSALLRGDFSEVQTPGAHYSFLEEPSVRVAATHIRQILAEAQEKQRSLRGD
jgi:amino acid adenylation domain-containing protein